VFRRGPGGWVSEALLEADDAEIGAQLGYDVDVRGDTVAAGAVADGNVGGVMVPGGGSVYMFERSGGVWNLTTEVAAAGRMPGENGGYSVAYDGRSLAVGAPRQVPAGCSGSCSEFGAAYVFEQNQAPIADASGTPTQVDSANGVDAEVVLDGSASSDPDGDSLSFAWYEGSQLLGQTATLPVTLGVGSHTIELRVSDGRADAAVSVVVEVVPANRPPVASVAASTIQVIADGPDGALVQLDGSSSSDPDGDALTFGWFEGDVALASGAVAAVRLGVGFHSVRLEVSDGQATSTAEVNVEVAPAVELNHAPTADASRTSQRVIAGDNHYAAVRLNGSLSSDPDGDELSYQWFRGDELLAQGIFARVTLPVGTHVIRLSVRDGSLSGDTEVVVRVLTPAQAVRSLILKVENADLPDGRKTAALALLKSAERSFESDRMLLGSHQLSVFQRLLEKSSKNRAVIRPLVNEAQAIIDAVRRR
jgi:hypothetical protein